MPPKMIGIISTSTFCCELTVLVPSSTAPRRRKNSFKYQQLNSSLESPEGEAANFM